MQNAPLNLSIAKAQGLGRRIFEVKQPHYNLFSNVVLKASGDVTRRMQPLGVQLSFRLLKSSVVPNPNDPVTTKARKEMLAEANLDTRLLSNQVAICPRYAYHRICALDRVGREQLSLQQPVTCPLYLRISPA